MDENDTNSGFEAMPSLKKTKTSVDLKDEESETKRNEKEKHDELELHKIDMMINMEQLLKRSHKREEKYFKLLIRTWALVGCIIVLLLNL